MLNLDKNTYNAVVEQMAKNEAVINEIYANFNNYAPDEQYIMLDIVQNMAIINEELQKYVIIYNQSIKPDEQSLEYVVITGDTIHSIARNLTGDYDNWKEILRFNNLSDLNLEIGTTLLIPRDLQSESI